jgi:RNA polymerase sigma-B factor
MFAYFKYGYDGCMADLCLCHRDDCTDRFAALAATTDPARRTALRNELVEAHLALARSIAGRFRGRGVPSEDLAQIAALAIVEAVDRFDVERDKAFSAFALPTVTGTLKRNFRDTRWAVHTPRRLQELHLQVRRATADLPSRLGHEPRTAEIAAYLGCYEADVRRGMLAGEALQPLSTDAPVTVGDGPTAMGDTLADHDDPYERVEERTTVHRMLGRLSSRELEVVSLHFFGDCTQSQIAERMGCSQMTVSRVMRTALARLRRTRTPVPV